VAVIVLIWSAQWVLILPTALLSGDSWRILSAKGFFFEALSPWISSLAIWIAPVVVILLAHALGLVWRGRSLWIVFDIIAIFVVVTASRWVIGPFLRVFAVKVTLAVYGWLAVSTLLALIVAGAFQLAYGRVDARRGHRSLSAVVWSVLAIAVMASAGWSWWIRSARPGDLDLFAEISVGSGDWIAVTGPSTGRFDYFPGFLINTADGRWISAHAGSSVYERGVEFSEDMSRAVWAEPYSATESKLMTVDLYEERLSPEWTGVVFSRPSRDMAVSPGGDRVAVIQSGTVTVFDINTGELLVAAQPSGEFDPLRIRFADETCLEVLTGMRIRNIDGSPQFEMSWKRHLLDVTARSLDDGEQINSAWRWWGGRLDDPLRNRLERREIDGSDRLVLVDSENREIVADLGEMPKQWSSVRVLTGGLIVVNREEEEQHFLQVFDSEGRFLERIDIELAGWARIGGEISDGKLAVGRVLWGPQETQPAQRSTVFIDIRTGRTDDVLDDVSPALGSWGVATSAGAWNVGSVATRLMEGVDGSLHLWDPETNDLKQLIPIPE